MEPEIWQHEYAQKFEKFAAKFPLTTLSYSVVNIACLNDAYSEILNWKQVQ